MVKSKNYNFSKKSFLILIGAGISQKFCIEKAHKMGINTIAVDRNINTEILKYCDVPLKIDFIKNEKKVLDWLELNNIKLIGVMSYCNEPGMKLAAKIREKYNLQGMNSKITNIMSQKHLQRKILTKANLPCPKWKVLKSNYTKKDILKLKKFLRFPIIIKPVDSAGSRGVTKIQYPRYLNTSIKKALKFSKIKNVIIEEYFSGTEFTIESFTINYKTYILAVTKKYKVRGTNKTVAYKLESLKKENKLYIHLGKLIVRALSKLGYQNGPAHSEIIYNREKNKEIIVETSGRGGGFKIFDGLVPAVCGFDAVKASILQSINKKIKIKKLLNNYAILKWFPSKKGTVKKIIGFNKIIKKNTPNIKVIAGSFVSIGDKVSAAISDSDRFGYILCWGKPISKVKKICRESNKFDYFKLE